MGSITNNTTVTGSVFDTGEKGSQKKGTMSMRSVKKWAIAAGAAALLGTSQMASAASVSSFINDFGLNVASDDDVERLIDRAPGGTAGVLDVGDAIRGIVNFHTLNSGGANLGGATGNNEWTAIFEIEVTSISNVNGGLADVTFGPSASFIAELGAGTDPGTMVRFFEDATVDFNFAAGPPPSLSEATATDGAFFWDLGFEDPSAASHLEAGVIVSDNGEGWVSRQGGLAFTAAAGVNAGSLIGSSNFAVNRLLAGIGDYVLIDQTLGPVTAGILGASPADSAEFIGGSTVRGAAGTPSAAAGWDALSDTSFTFNVIPTPMAVGPALLTLGLMLARRGRREA